MNHRPLVLLALAACSQDITVSPSANVPPGVTIESPSEGATFTDLQTVELRGRVRDANGLGDLVTVQWTSNLDGTLYEGLELDADGLFTVPVNLSIGQHVLTLRAVDAAGLDDSASVTVRVDAADQQPQAQIVSPGNLDAFTLAGAVPLEGEVSDPNQPPHELWVSWEATLQGAGLDPILIDEGYANAQGGITAAWTQIPQVGTWRLRMTVTDADDNVAVDEVLIVVADDLDADNDGDGWSVNQGDCDDNDPNASPGLDEVCGDGVDNDCSGIADDKDLDLDGHVDEACADTYAGPLPADDCDDDDASVHPGADEVLDGVDNDCDGRVDDGTDAWDNDGDCACVTAPCTGSDAPACTTLTGGDCDDTDATTFPGADDPPDGAFTDNDCDGIDGTAADSVFVSTSGSDSSTTCSQAAPCRTIDHAMTRASALGRPWVNLQAGTYTGGVDLVDGVELVGGFDAGWSRGPHTQAAHQVVLQGGYVIADQERMTVRARSVDAGLHDLIIEGPDAAFTTQRAGRSSYALHATSSTLSMARVRVEAGPGAEGSTSTNGASATQVKAPNGFPGDEGTGSTCLSGRADGGSGAIGGANNGGAGGRGGTADTSCINYTPTAGDNGISGDGPGGFRGSGGAAGPSSEGSQCEAGDDGDPGGTPHGAAGSAASWRGRMAGQNGWFWYGTNGADGADGAPGGGGGGGGGGGAADGWVTGQGGGGGGGGGGAGGAPGTAGSGGGAGGASFGAFLVDSTLLAHDSTFVRGTGAAGRSGGQGGAGQPGGDGGLGGLGHSNGCDGGDGGNGGNGGAGAGGGGGSGGMSYAVFRRNSTYTATGATTATGGSGGPGGTGGFSVGNSGPSGQAGQVGDVFVCLNPSGC